MKLQHCWVILHLLAGLILWSVVHLEASALYNYEDLGTLGGSGSFACRHEARPPGRMTHVQVNEEHLHSFPIFASSACFAPATRGNRHG